MELINLNKEIPNEFYNKINTSLLKKNNDNISIINNIISKYLNITNKKYISILISNMFYDYLFINIIAEYKKIYKKKPHIILSIHESKELNKICILLLKKNLITLSIIKPNNDGLISINQLEKKIKSNTCLVCISYNNNILGTVYDIQNIQKICNQNNIVFYCDISDIFLYNSININNIDIVNISFNYYKSNINGLIINSKIIKNYNLNNTIEKFKDYENKLKNKNESLNFISYMIDNKIINYKENNNKIINLKKNFIEKINEYIKILSYQKYLTIKNKNLIDKVHIILINSIDNSVSINSNILLSIYINKIKFSNIKFQKHMQQYGIKIGIPNIKSLDYLNLDSDSILVNGLLLINFNEFIKLTDINYIIKSIIKSINLQYSEFFQNILDNTKKNKSTINSIKRIKKKVRFTNPEFIILTKKKNISNKSFKNIKSILK